MIDPRELMQLAIDKTVEGIADGQSPFGCAIANQSGVVVVAHNVVKRTTDITAHAEVTAIREACRELDRIFLQDCIVATTCEPCPMCMSALHWARVQHVYFGASIGDAAATGFNELSIPAAEILQTGESTVTLTGGIEVDQCGALFQRWIQDTGGETY